MKWYFAISEASIDRADHDWRGLVYGAVRSATRNTRLVPHLLYDGNPSDFTRTLEVMGVRIIPHRVAFYDRLAARNAQLAAEGDAGDWYLKIASGCFLRMDIPEIEKDDKFVLYTDCDVTFLRDPILSDMQPRFFAVAPEGQIGDYEDMNSGVMFINVDGMRDTYSELTAYTVNNLIGKLDQDILREFYAGTYDKLPHELNWKPYWGINHAAQIVHWHGPKPVMIDRMMRSGTGSHVDIWNRLYARSNDGYKHYLDIWNREMS